MPTDVYQKRPDETIEEYYARLPGSKPGAPTTGAARPGIDTPAPPTAPAPGAASNPDADALARSLGYGSYAEAITKLTGPSEDTTKFYSDAYSAAGLDALSGSIKAKKDALTGALGKIDDNPWLDEASRIGRSRNLQQLANGDISNLEDQYRLSLQKVHDLVSTHASDLSRTDASNKAKLAFLEAYAKQQADAATAKTKADSAVPKTIKGPNGSVFQYNPDTGEFVQVIAGKAPQSPVDQNQKLIDNFNKSVVDRATLDKAGTREQFIRQLQAQYPQIDPDDIARKVYETWPDGYETKSKSSRSL